MQIQSSLHSVSYQARPAQNSGPRQEPYFALPSQQPLDVTDSYELAPTPALPFKKPYNASPPDIISRQQAVGRYNYQEYLLPGNHLDLVG